jgi:hypothetical protein
LFPQAGEDGNEEFDEMMEQLLERDGTQETLAEVIEQSIGDADEAHHDSQVRKNANFIKIVPKTVDPN